MLSGVILVWFMLAVLSVVFVAIDLRFTPKSPVSAWLSRPTRMFVAARRRQALGSTMHCVAGDGLGILAGAVLASFMEFSATIEGIPQYLLGVGFGWSIFLRWQRDDSIWTVGIKARLSDVAILQSSLLRMRSSTRALGKSHAATALPCPALEHHRQRAALEGLTADGHGELRTGRW